MNLQRLILESLESAQPRKLREKTLRSDVYLSNPELTDDEFQVALQQLLERKEIESTPHIDRGMLYEITAKGVERLKI